MTTQEGLDRLTAVARGRRWTEEERDGWYVLIRREYPDIRFVPSSREFGRLFGRANSRREQD